MKRLLVFPCVMVLFFAVTANATLHDRGGGLIYDDVLDITWLQDANLAATEDFGLTGTAGFYSNGLIEWWTANNAWIFQMNNANYLGYNDWRLASMDVNGDDTVVRGESVSEIDCRDNEYAYMFYHNLGGSYTDDLRGDQTVGDVTLNNIQVQYWSETVYALNPDWAWTFIFNGGNQTIAETPYGTTYYAWAVRDGDSSPVPIPSAVWLLGSGLIGIVGFRRKFRKS